jgi:hypothetical protein
VTHAAVQRLRRPGVWLWLAVALGAAARLYLLGFTQGTFDVAIKHLHGSQVLRLGLLEYYRQSPLFNHPPPMGEVFAGLVALARASAVPFPVLLRLPFALADAATALLLLQAFRGDPWRYAIAAAYWLHPLAVLFSAYHGNTDSAVALFALLAVVLAGAGRPGSAGVALGIGLWVKLPVLVAAPALFFALPGRRERLRFGAVAAAVAALGYLPVAWRAPGLVLQRIAGYPGSGVETPSGIAIWGIGHVLGLGGGASGWLEAHNTLLCWIPLLALAWLRRRQRATREVGATVCGSFVLLYGLTSFWAWQYLAWSIPFWFFLGWRFALPATLLLTGYVYGAYALFTGSPWLQGRWDFVHHAPWPLALDVLRDASVLWCLAWGLALLALAAAAELARRREARA